MKKTIDREEEMAAPKGNKFAYGNPHAGRPATWTKEVVEQEADLLIEWAQRDDAIVLREFAPLRGYAHKYMYRWSDQKEPSYNEVFCHAFEFARSIVGARREKVAFEKSTQRDLGMYSDELDKYEREREEFKSKLKQKEAEVEAHTLVDLVKASNANELSQK